MAKKRLVVERTGPGTGPNGACVEVKENRVVTVYPAAK